MSFLILCAFITPAWSSAVEKKNGKKVEGIIMERDDRTLYVETAAGVENIPLEDIATVDGRTFLQEPAAPSNSEYPRTAKFKLGPAAKIKTGFQEDEVKVFYETHPERFKTPAKVKLAALEFPSKPEDSKVNEILQKAGRDPGSVSGWKNMGWFEKGNAMGDQRIQNLFPEEADRLLSLKKGGITKCLRSGTGMYYIFRAEDREEPRLPPLAKIREKVKWEMMNEQGKSL